MSASEVSASAPCLIDILKRFAWRVIIIRGRLSRLKTRIQIAAKKNQPATALESQQEEEWTVELERYKDLLNDCVAWIHERTGIPTSKLLEVATSTPEGEEWDYIYTELKKLEERRVNAVLWTALLSRDLDALVSVSLLPSSESSPPAPEMETQGDKADDDSDPMTMPSVAPVPSSESGPPAPEMETQGDKADNDSDPMTMPSVAPVPSSESSPPAPEMETQGGKADSDADPTTILDEFVESDYAEPIFKNDLAFLFDVDRATIARRIKSRELRAMPGTLATAKKVRIHGDDFPAGLKRPNERKQKLSSQPKNGKRQ